MAAFCYSLVIDNATKATGATPPASENKRTNKPEHKR